MKKNSPKVSVVTPTFNGKNKIDKTITSLLDQDFAHDYELIVVDDGSTDGTSEFLKDKYRDEINSGKLKVIRKKNGGVSSARNRGIEAASGEYITFLDGDDYALRDRLSKLHDKITKDDAEFVHAKSLFVDEKGKFLNDENYANGKPREGTHWAKYWKTFGDDNFATAGHLKKSNYSPVHTQTVMVKKTLLDKLRKRDGFHFDEHLDFVEDFDIWKRLATLTEDEKMTFLDDFVSKYTTGTGNSFSNPKRNELGHQALLNREKAVNEYGKNLSVLVLAGSTSGSQKKLMREYSEGLLKNGITNVKTLMQTGWFSQAKKYSSKKVTNSMNNDKYLENDTYFEEGRQQHTSLEAMLAKAKASDADVIHILGNRWADDIDKLKELGKPIVYKLNSLLAHEIDKDPEGQQHLSPAEGDTSGESILYKQEKLLNAVDSIHVETEEYAQIVKRHYPHLSDKVVVVGNSPDFNENEIEKIYKARQSDGAVDPNRFLSVGRLDNVKGYIQTLKAFGEVIKTNPEAMLDICGDSDNEDFKGELQRIVREYGLQKNVKFHGNVDKNRLKSFYKKAVGFIQPSIHEQCSITMLNAAQSGLAVITGNIHEVSGLYNEDFKTGLVAKQKKQGEYSAADVNDLAGKVKYVMSHPAQSKQLGENARKMSLTKGYTRAGVIKNIMKDYKRLTKKTK